MIDRLTLVGPPTSGERAPPVRESAAAGKARGSLLAHAAYIYCTLLHPEYVFVLHCSTAHPPPAPPCRHLGVQTVDIPYYCNGPHRYCPAWRTVKPPSRTHGNKPGQPGATQPAGPGSQRGINKEWPTVFKDPSHGYRCVCGRLIIVLMRAIPLHRNHSIAHTSTQKHTKAHVRTPSARRCPY